MTTLKYTFPKVCYKTVDPTFNDDISMGYIPGTLLINTETDERFVCKENTLYAAVWVRDIDYINPAADDVPSAQDMVDSHKLERSVLVTPQIYYQDGLIDYDLTIPGNAFSAGPITIEEGRTITVGLSGSWSII
jgi:hypothetical protein